MMKYLSLVCIYPLATYGAGLKYFLNGLEIID